MFMHHKSDKRGAVIVLTGLAGVGKTTIAAELHKLLNLDGSETLPLYARNSSLFHNHLTIDFAKALVCRSNSARTHMALRQTILDLATEVMKDDPNTNRIFIITGYALMGVDGEYLRRREVQEYLNLARLRKVPFVWLHLVCQPSDYRMRVEDSTRKITKIRNYDKLMADIAEEYDSQLEGFQGLNREGVCTVYRQVDTSNKSPIQSATLIMNILRRYSIINMTASSTVS